MHIYTYWGLKYVPSNSTMVAKEGDLILLDNEVHKVVKVLHRFRNITDLQTTNWKGTETRHNLHVTEYKVLVPYDTHKEENEPLDAKVQSGYYTATENEEDVKSEIEATKKHVKAVKESGKTVNDYRKEETTKRCKLKAPTNKFNRLFLKSVIDTDSLQVGRAYLIGGAGMKNVHGLYTGSSCDQQYANFLIVETDRSHGSFTVSAEQLFAEERHILDLEAELGD